MAAPVSRTPTWAEVLRIAMQAALAEVHVCLPGRVENYDKDKQLADVRIAVQRRTPLEDGTSLLEEFPVIPGVPVEWSQSANFFMSFPLAQGDFVWLHVAEQSIDAWLSKGGVGVQDPVDRTHDITDCWAVPARNPQSPLSETESDSLVIGGKGSAPRAYFESSLIELGQKGGGTDFVSLAQKVLTELQNLQTNVNTNYTKIATTLATGSNGGGPVVFGTPYIPTSAPAPNSVAATKVKAV